MNTQSWKKRKRTGGVKRKLYKAYKKASEKELTGQVLVPSLNIEGSVQSKTIQVNQSSVLTLMNIKTNSETSSDEFKRRNDLNLLLTNKNQRSVSSLNIEDSVQSNTIQDNQSSVLTLMNIETNSDDFDCNINHIDSSSTDEDDIYEKNNLFKNKIKNWAVARNISQIALKELSEIINERIPDILPKDPRSILGTTRNIVIKKIEPGGEYWHNGLISSLSELINNWPEITKNLTSISLNVNFDGLPIYKSSKYEFWPILANVFEIPKAQPFIVGIYYGIGKPKNLTIYLEDFITEMKQLLNDGIIVSSNRILTVKIRCFICDSPARAFIKGVCNFNGKHGCLKCVTVGEYSHKSHTVVFPGKKCASRTDEGFRNKIYGLHHKYDSPLLQLPVDMVKDFPVADSLHLIDLGVMKRLLLGWRDGTFGKYITKWSSKEIDMVNIFLKE